MATEADGPEGHSGSEWRGEEARKAAQDLARINEVGYVYT